MGISLRKHFSAVLRERDRAVKAALTSLDRRLHLLNELRGEVATRAEIVALKERMDRMDGRKEGMSVTMAVIVTCITILISVVGLYVALHRT